MPAWIKRRVIIAAALLIGIVLATVKFWPERPPQKALALAPLIAELWEYKKENGTFPQELAELESFAAINHSYTIYYGERVSETELQWEASPVSRCDLSIMVTDKFFGIFAPTGKMKMISFTSFPVWRYTSKDPEWESGSIHWSIGDGGTFWGSE